jgi:ribosomal-protein-alanine N-acetyltransferase
MCAAAAVTLRVIERRDLESLQRHANDRDVWLSLRNIFPHPYTAADAEIWLGIVDAAVGRARMPPRCHCRVVAQ